MVSLEVFGLSGKKAVNVESKIFDQFKGGKCAKEIVVILHNSTARNARMVSQPFIRICGNSSTVLAREIERRLTPLGLKLQRLGLAKID